MENEWNEKVAQLEFSKKRNDANRLEEEKRRANAAKRQRKKENKKQRERQALVRFIV